jgi:hypothetical protein
MERRLLAHVVPPLMRLSCLWCLGNFCRLNASHHFFLRDQVVDSLKQTEQALHVSAPLIQHIICVSWLGEADDPGRSVNLGIHSFRCDQLADVLLCLILSQIEKLGQARHLDACVVFGNDTDVVLDDTLAEILPSLICLLVCRLALRDIEHISAAEVGTEQLGNFWPSHEFMYGEEFEELCVKRDLVDSGVFLYSVEEIGLFVVIGGEDDIVDNSLQDLRKLE